MAIGVLPTKSPALLNAFPAWFPHRIGVSSYRSYPKSFHRSIDTLRHLTRCSAEARRR